MDMGWLCYGFGGIFLGGMNDKACINAMPDSRTLSGAENLEL
jgi:hypothetical protein